MKLALLTARCPDWVRRDLIWACSGFIVSVLSSQVSVSGTPSAPQRCRTARRLAPRLARRRYVSRGITPAWSWPGLRPRRAFRWERRSALAGSREPVGFLSVYLLWVFAHGFATLPQWPPINWFVGRILRTRHSRVTRELGRKVARLLGIPPMSLPRIAASDMGGFARSRRRAPAPVRAVLPAPNPGIANAARVDRLSRRGRCLSVL